MSRAMQEHFVPLRATWKQRGYDLDLGIGIAHPVPVFNITGLKA